MISIQSASERAPRCVPIEHVSINMGRVEESEDANS
jgi:hypothetical protein